MIKSLAAGLGLALMALPAHAIGVPENYPPSYKALLAAAEKEGKVVVYSNTEQFAVNPLWAPAQNTHNPQNSACPGF